MRIYDLLHQACLKDPASIAVIQDSGQLTYNLLYDYVLYVSDFLTQNGCAGGVKVGLYFSNSIEYLVAFFAVSKAGGTIVPLSREMTLFELQSKTQSVNISMIISDELGCVELEKSTLQIGILLLCLNKDNGIRIEAKNICDSIVDDANKDVALIISTSGSTGQSKHVMLTDFQLISNMMAYQNVMSFQEKQMVYCALPFCHIYSISAQILTHISLADTLFIPRGPFFIKNFLETVRDYHITISAFVPYYAIIMNQIPESRGFDLESLKCILLAGGKTPVDTIYGLREKYPSVKFLNTYGLTEASPRISVAGPEPSDFPVGSVGRPMSGISVKILDEQDSELSSGQIGQIVVKGPGLMKGYYKQSLLTKEVLSDGWLKTGDIGKISKKGELYIEARLKDLIISGGRNIYPYEVEECLLKYSNVIEAVVVRKPHSKLQEIPFAFIVTRNNIKIETSELILHCRKYLSNFKIPHAFQILEKIPKINASKVDRTKLIQKLDGEKL